MVSMVIENMGMVGNFKMVESRPGKVMGILVIDAHFSGYDGNGFSES